MKSQHIRDNRWSLLIVGLVLMLVLPHLALAQGTPPETTLTSYPVNLGPSRLDASTFAFSSSIAGSTFDCSLDGASWAPCSSPVNYASLSGGSHTFEVRAVAPDGTPDATPASRTWTVSSYESWSREVPTYVAGVQGEWAKTSAIALDSSGAPHLVYATEGSVYYSRWVPVTKSWSTQLVYQVSFSMGGDVSLALDEQGHPHISFFHYYGTTGAGLLYATWDGTAWATAVVDALPTGYDVYGQSNSLALDAAGHPHIAYFNSKYGDGSLSGLWYASFDGASWSKEHVDETCSKCGIYGTSLALDAAGNPRIGYSAGDVPNRDLKYAAWNGTGWDIQTVDSFGDVGSFPSLVLDGAGIPHLSYASATDLVYAVWDQALGAWNRQLAAVGSYASSNAGSMKLALDTSGRPHIGFGAPALLHYVSWDGQAWQKEAVGSPNQYGDGGSMALDASGRAHFSVNGTYSREYYVRDKALSGALRATVALAGSSYPIDAQLEVCLSGGAIGATPNCQTMTGNGGSVVWSGLMPGGDYAVGAPDAADWSEPAGQSGLTVSTGGTTDVYLTFAYTGAAEPDTAITGRPMFDRLNSSDQASFQFESSQTDCTFECSLDGAVFAACTSPQTYGGLAAGSHSFQVQALNARTAVDPSPAVLNWTVDTGSAWQLAQVEDWITHSFPGHMVFDGAGFPRAVHTDPEVESWYIPWNGQTWEKTLLPGGKEDGVWQSRLAVGADGRTHMVYASAYLGGWEEYYGLRYAVSNGSGWDVETIGGVGSNQGLDFMLDASGQAHIAFLDNDAGVVKYGTRDEADWRGKAWKLETVGSAQGIHRLSLALDANGYPHLAWVDASGASGMYSGETKYAARSASGWGTVETIDTLDYVWKAAASLALGADGRPRVAYCDESPDTGGSDLYYAVREASSIWQVQLVRHSGDAVSCWYPSLALDADGTPYISSYDRHLVGPQLHVWDGAAWVTDNIEQFPGGYDSAADTFMILDAEGRPNVLYPVWAYGANVLTEHKFIYARRGEAEGPVESAPAVTTQPTAQTATVGDEVSFSAAASGYPVPTVQWQVSTDDGGNWSDVADATSSPLTLIASLDKDGYQYRAVFTNSQGSAISDPATLTVNKMNATCNISGWTGPYDGSPHGAGGTCTGAGGEVLSGLDLGATFADVPGGTAHWTFADVTGNYNDQSGDVDIVMGRADAICSITGWSGTYDGSPHGAGGACTGVDGAALVGVDLGATFADVPGGTADWTFVDVTGNYNNQSGAVGIAIGRADAICSITGWSGTYDGSPHGADGACTGVDGAALVGVDLGATFADVPGGTADWTFVDVTGNYNNQSGAVGIAIGRADANCNITGWTGPFDGSPHGAGGTCTGLDGAELGGLDLGATFTDVPGGTAHWTFTDVTGSYNDQSGDVNVVITEANTAPVANPGGPYLGAVNTAVAFDGSGSSDPDDDPLIYAWAFGDGGSGEGATPAHSYAETGIYDVCLTVNDGTVDSEPACSLAVVYDPAGGFVTGGGWIDSPVGAYVPDPALRGQATFGFVSKYKKGQNVPSGNTEFQFAVAGLNFHSETYEWLLVNKAGTNAQFKGSGTVNGGLDQNGNPYKFMIWAGDGTPNNGADTFRIRIWWEGADGVEHDVYDNGVEQPIGGGSIVIHTK